MRLQLILYLVVFTVLSSVAKSVDNGSKSYSTALEFAWAFSECLNMDAKDQAREQERISLAYLLNDRPEAAAAHAAKIPNWRKGVVRADIATYYAEKNNIPSAKKLLAMALLDMEQEDEWQEERIATHIAQANAYLGQHAAESIPGVEPNPQQKKFYDITNDLSSGQQARAIESIFALELEILPEQWDLYLWSANQFILLASHPALESGQREKLLELAYEKAGAVPGWKSLAFKLQVIQAFHELGKPSVATEKLDTVVPQITALSLPGYIKLPLVAEAARVSAIYESESNFDACSAIIDDQVNGLQSIEQPAVLSSLACSYAIYGNGDKAHHNFSKAVSVATDLKNARPRAIALVGLCLELDQAKGVDLGKFKPALLELLNGFE